MLKYFLKEKYSDNSVLRLRLDLNALQDRLARLLHDINFMPRIVEIHIERLDDEN